MNKKVMAIIPARGGSKGIPGKNLVDLGGIPLIAHSIMAARKCRYITRTIVTTDCPEIADVALEWGAEVPFMRPKELSEDTSPLTLVISHALQKLRGSGFSPEAIVPLFTTHPFRSINMMNYLTERLLEGTDVCTVRRFVVSRYSYKYEKGEKSIWLHESQQPRVCFRRYGLFVGQILSRKAQRMYVHELTREHEWVDIDTEDDLESARKMVEEERFIPEWT